ncbi:MAG TPA: FHA domain-containing protein [Ktedonobacterales bacterium]|jgi:hypothetical protein
MPGALLGPFGRYELGLEPVTIGRSSSNKLVINDNQVSGRHLQVFLQGTGYMLVDVGSSNGTFFNGGRLAPQMPQPLSSGDVIIIGSTRLVVELAEGAFPAAPQPAAPQPTAFAPSEQMGFSPALTNDAPLPPFGAPPTPSYGPPAQPGAPFQPAGPPPNPFGPYPGNPPGQAQGYYPGAPAFGAPPQGYQGAPGVGVGAARRGSKRFPLLIGGVLAVLLILGGTGLAFFLLSHRTPQGPSIPNATTQVVTPFYDNLKKQNYTAATGMFTPDYLELHGGQQNYITVVFEQLDKDRGAVTDYHIVSVKPVGSSTTNEVASVNVTRDPNKGAFNPDTLQLVYEKGKWQISQWTPGQRQSQV